MFYFIKINIVQVNTNVLVCLISSIDGKVLLLVGVDWLQSLNSLGMAWINKCCNITYFLILWNSHKCSATSVCRYHFVRVVEWNFDIDLFNKIELFHSCENLTRLWVLLKWTYSLFNHSSIFLGKTALRPWFCLLHYRSVVLACRIVSWMHKHPLHKRRGTRSWLRCHQRLSLPTGSNSEEHRAEWTYATRTTAKGWWNREHKPFLLDKENLGRMTFCWLNYKV